MIERPVAEVFSAVVDAGNFAAWNPTITGSRQLTSGGIGEGTRFEWKLRGFGTVRQELQEFERDRRVRIVPESRSISGGHRFTFTDLGVETRVDHELEMIPKGPLALMAPMMRRLARRNLETTADALKRQLESGKGGPGRSTSGP